MAQRDWLEKDYYNVLGVDKNASKDEIKRAYRKLAQKFHPDANKGDKGAEERFKEISEAHAILSNEDKRKEYDEMRRYAESGSYFGPGFGGPGGQGVRVNVGDIGDLFGGGDVGSIFEEAFGFRPRRPQRGGDVETEVSLSFDDAIEGTTVSIPTGGKARIPAGVVDGSRIKVTGKGQPARQGGEAGDLYVRVHVEPHPVFKTAGKGDLEVAVPVTIAEAALGTKVEVPTLTDPVTVKVPAGTQHGKRLRVRGRGAPTPKGGTGDLIVRIDVHVPEKLSRREKDLLQQFADAHEASPRAHLEAQINKSKNKVQ